jgi:hypothetical protein
MRRQKSGKIFFGIFLFSSFLFCFIFILLHFYFASFLCFNALKTKLLIVFLRTIKLHQTILAVKKLSCFIDCAKMIALFRNLSEVVNINFNNFYFVSACFHEVVILKKKVFVFLNIFLIANKKARTGLEIHFLNDF